mgnify:CR=1 FL=1
MTPCAGNAALPASNRETPKMASTLRNAMIPNPTLKRLRQGKLALGFCPFHLRSVSAAMLGVAMGYDWLFIDSEHGAFTTQETSQLCLAALPLGITPIVRVCADALDEGTRALDNGAMGLVIPHVDTPAQARRVAEAFRFPPLRMRSWGRCRRRSCMAGRRWARRRRSSIGKT